MGGTKHGVSERVTENVMITQKTMSSFHSWKQTRREEKDMALLRHRERNEPWSQKMKPFLDSVRVRELTVQQALTNGEFFIMRFVFACNTSTAATY